MIDSKRKTNIHLLLILTATVGIAALIVEGIVRRWEFWVLPLLAAAVLVMWWMHISQALTAERRERVYVWILVSAVFFHGVHAGDFFDISLIIILLLSLVFALRKRMYIELVIVEYVVILMVQLILIMNGGDDIELPRLLMHILAVFVVYRVYVHLLHQEESRQKQQEEFLKKTDDQDRAMRDFLANVSHEFRTPINAVTGLSELVYRDNPDRRLLEIAEAGRRMSAEISEITDYTEITSSDILPEQNEYRLSELLRGIILEFSKKSRQKQLEFVCDCDPMLPERLSGDSFRIRKVLYQTIGNAIKFTERGGICLCVTAAKREYGINLDFEITDTGSGMTKDEIEQLGVGFFQGNKDRDRSGGGIGIGYSIIYGYVRAMEGFVGITSKKGEGTTVRISIPQGVISQEPAVTLTDSGQKISAVCLLSPDRDRHPKLREAYERMFGRFAESLHIQVQTVPGLTELVAICENEPVTHVIVGERELGEYSGELDVLSRVGVIVVSDGLDSTAFADRFAVVSRPIFAPDLILACNGRAISKQADELPTYEGIKVLIADDEELNLEVAVGIFEELGLSCDTASRGAEAVLCYESSDYDLVFLDHMMPGMDGVETKNRICRTKKWQRLHTPLIIFTANAAGGARDFFNREGFSGFLEKPLDKGELKALLYTIIGGPKQGGEF